MDNRHDAFSVVRKELRYAPSTSEYLLQVGDIQITKGQMTALLDFLKPPTTITIEESDWSDISNPDAVPFTKQVEIAAPRLITPSTTVELINNDPILFA